MHHIGSRLHTVPLKQLRPTQMTVGFREVRAKQEEWAALGKKKRIAAMAEEFFPAVMGPRNAYYILDHHHSAVALDREGAKDVRVGIVKDLSALGTEAFWVYLDHLSWVHPYDKDGRRRPLKEMPGTLSGLRDDPYRSLAGAVRDRGGFAKSDAPFLEFLWTNYLRATVKAKAVKSHFDKTVAQALKLAHSHDAQYLPGWVGKRK